MKIGLMRNLHIAENFGILAVLPDGSTNNVTVASVMRNTGAAQSELPTGPSAEKDISEQIGISVVLPDGSTNNVTLSLIHI